MKETIYTIPINEAFDSKCSCALCKIESRIENERVDAALGPAMMEPDFRIESNKKGFCRHHYKMLLDCRRALPLALVLQTHAKEQNTQIFQNVTHDKNAASKIFKKQSAEILAAEKIIACTEKFSSSCIICENMRETMDRYLKNLIYMWKTEPDFREKFSSQNGFCIPHFAELLKCALKELGKKDFSVFFNDIVSIQEKSQTEMYEDISSFIRLFDHNSDKKADANVKNSIRRTIHKYSGLNLETD